MNTDKNRARMCSLNKRFKESSFLLFLSVSICLCPVLTSAMRECRVCSSVVLWFFLTYMVYSYQKAELKSMKMDRPHRTSPW